MLRAIQNYFRSLLLLELLKGMSVTGGYLFRRKFTVQYPEEATYSSPYERGLHEFEPERCIICELCAKACPVDCIYIETEGKGKERMMTRYAIDYNKCIWCSLCTENCHTGSITMSHDYDHAVYDRKSLVYEFMDPADGLNIDDGQDLGSALAIGAGMSDGLGFGANTRVALITRGLAEITRIGVAMGAEPMTFAGLAGMGDLVLTCTDNLSRNRRMGLALAAGKTVEEAQEEIQQVVEAVGLQVVQHLPPAFVLGREDRRTPAEALQDVVANLRVPLDQLEFHIVEAAGLA